MKIKMMNTYMASLLLQMAAALMACTRDAEEPGMDLPDTPAASARIYISGGGSDELTANTKGSVGSGDNDEPGDAPNVDGVCRADAVDIRVYATTTSGMGDFPADDKYQLETKITKTSISLLGKDRWTEASATSTLGNISTLYDYKYLKTKALAYSDIDKGKFTTAMDGAMAASALSVNDVTPELYYGMIRAKSNGAGYDGSNECFWWENEGLGDVTVDVSFYGRIYRMVSQVNLKITDIPTESVDKIALYMKNYPRKVGLHGTHGKYYPLTVITDITDTSGETPVLLASETITGQSTVTLSSFLLPSEVGGKLVLYVTYKDGKEAKGYPLRPGKSYFLTGSDAGVYKVGEELKNGDDCYVYDNRKDKFCFYSYANVRVNLSGKFENVAVETGESNIFIEVEPNFEKIHDFEII